MEISNDQAGDWTVVSVAGEIDLHHSPQLRIELMRCLDEGNSTLLNMARVSHIDSSGIAAMVQALSHARRNGIDFALARPTEPVMRILHLTRLDSVFTFYDSVEAATGS